MATLDQAITQMLADGMPPFPDGGPRLDTGRVVRYGPRRRAWYRLFEFQARNGRRYVSGAYGVWGLLESTKIRMDLQDMHADERERLQRSMAELEAREREKRERQARFAANRARQQWQAGKAQLPAGVTCEYLARKGVAAEKGLRFMRDGTVLVPMIRYDVEEAQEQSPEYTGPRRMVGLQKIAPDGSKRFNKGMAKAGAMCRLGKVKPGLPVQPILVAEGLATALSIRMALAGRLPVFVAFDAYNLGPAAAILRRMHPDAPVVFCADDDWRTEGNPGRQMAERAAQAIGNAQVVWPVFAGDARGDKETDFNDLQARNGLAAVAAQLEPVLLAASSSGEAKGAKKSRGAAAAPTAGGAGESGGGDGPDGAAPTEGKGGLLARFTYIYPTDTAYDAVLGDIVKIEHMRLMFGSALVNWWLENGKRRVVNLPDVVFDPTGQAQAHQLNLFRGFEMKPSAAGSCRRLLALLYFLCGEDMESSEAPVTTWVLRWLAYPLQHPGAKMATAVVMSSKEGAGKNLFFGAVADIYGQYGGVITQRQLEGDFNLWLSAKLFLIANEVVTRQEMRHNVGYLKHLITEPRIYINRKNKDERWESNHVNMVFLSNEDQPLQVGPDDRRYMVLRAPGPLPESDYGLVVDELRNGGVPALYQYLLELDLGDFNPHTKPVYTEAKEELITVGLGSAQLFWKDWHEGELDVAYAPALVDDVYPFYMRWCQRNGHKAPLSSNRFVPAFMSMNGVRRVRQRVFDPAAPAAAERKLRRVFVMGQRPAEMSEQDWLDKSVKAFHGQTRRHDETTS